MNRRAFFLGAAMVLLTRIVVAPLGRPRPSKVKLPTGESVTPSGAIERSGLPVAGCGR